ncbi:peptidase P60 [Paracoccaceae bacterium GXU_MW_L88]
MMAANGADRAAVLIEARRWIGTPYQHQASLRGVGADCLGLIRGVWRGVIGAEPEPLPPYAPHWGRGDPALERAVARWFRPGGARALPGQVMLFALQARGPARHAAIASGPGRIIHATEALGVAEMEISDALRRRIRGIYDFPGRN